MTRAIVTSTYRYKRPPRKRKAVALDVPAITIDPKTRTAKKSRRPVLAQEAAAEDKTRAPRAGVSGEATTPSTTAQRVGAHDGSVKPQPANDDGPRASAIVTAKKGRRPVWSGAAAEVTANPPLDDEEAGKQQPNPAPAARKSAIVTVRDRKTVQRQREQQQMALLLPIGGKKRSAIVGKPRAPEMTPEEHKRRGDAADAMFQEMKRAIAEQCRR